MANKHYNVTQHVTLNGQKRSVSFVLYCEEADLTAFTALLEGGYTVTERNDALTDMSGAGTNVTSYKRTNRISYNAKHDDGSFLSGAIRPFKGSIIFKSTASSEDLGGVVKLMKPWSYAPAVTPVAVNSGFTEDYTG